MSDDEASRHGVLVTNNNLNSSPAPKPDGIKAQSSRTSTTLWVCAPAGCGDTTDNPDTTNPITATATSSRTLEACRDPETARQRIILNLQDRLRSRILSLTPPPPVKPLRNRLFILSNAGPHHNFLFCG